MENYTDRKTEMRDAILIAATPLLVESINLLTDAVKEVREQMEWARISRKETAPLEKKLKVLRLEAELEDFKLDREERREDRQDRQEERTVLKLEREVRTSRASRSLPKSCSKPGHVGGEVQINGFDYDS
jgi:hypothetical protein